MQIEQPTVDVYSPLTATEAADILSEGFVAEDPALKMVVQDAQTAENFENQKRWLLSWDQAAILYQSPYFSRYWEGTMVEKANVPFFTVATAVNSLVPQITNGLFFDNPPFLVQPRPGTRSQTARAISALMAYQLEDIGFREELRLGVSNAVLFGTGIWKYGWETYERERVVYRRKHPPTVVPHPMAEAGGQDVEILPENEEVEAEVVTEYVDRPIFEHIVNCRHVLIDPKTNRPNIQSAKYVIHRYYMTYSDLEKLRDREDFTLPSEDEVRSWFVKPEEEAVASQGETSINNPQFDARAVPRYESTTINPLEQPLEILERWDKKQVTMVVQRKKVLCNADNPYGKIPFLSVNWWDVPESFWGMGLAKTIGSEQRIQQGITNTWLDNAALNLNGVYVRVRGKNVPTQSIRISPGKIVDVDDKDGFKPIQRFEPVPEAGVHIEMSQMRAEKVSGANEPSTQGVAGSTGHSNLARSATGANLIASGAGNRIADHVEKLVDQVVVPFLYALMEMNREMMPLSLMRDILGKELQHDFLQPEVDPQGKILGKGGDVIDILNARVKFSIGAGAKLVARQKMAAALPILTQFLMSSELTEQLAIQGMKVDVREIMRMFYTVSEWKNEQDVVVQMTDEDKQRYQRIQQGQQMAQAQQQAALEQQKAQNKSELSEQDHVARAGRDVIKNALEQSSLAGETPGAPIG